MTSNVDENWGDDAPPPPLPTTRSFSAPETSSWPPPPPPHAPLTPISAQNNANEAIAAAIQLQRRNATGITEAAAEAIATAQRLVRCGLASSYPDGALLLTGEENTKDGDALLHFGGMATSTARGRNRGDSTSLHGLETRRDNHTSFSSSGDTDREEEMLRRKLQSFLYGPSGGPVVDRRGVPNGPPYGGSRRSRSALAGVLGMGLTNSIGEEGEGFDPSSKSVFAYGHVGSADDGHNDYDEEAIGYEANPFPSRRRIPPHPLAELFSGGASSPSTCTPATPLVEANIKTADTFGSPEEECEEKERTKQKGLADDEVANEEGEEDRRTSRAPSELHHLEKRLRTFTPRRLVFPIVERSKGLIRGLRGGVSGGGGGEERVVECGGDESAVKRCSTPLQTSKRLTPSPSRQRGVEKANPHRGSANNNNNNINNHNRRSLSPDPSWPKPRGLHPASTPAGWGEGVGVIEERKTQKAARDLRVRAEERRRREKVKGENSISGGGDTTAGNVWRSVNGGDGEIVRRRAHGISEEEFTSSSYKGLHQSEDEYLLYTCISASHEGEERSNNFILNQLSEKGESKRGKEINRNKNSTNNNMHGIATAAPPPTHTSNSVRRTPDQYILHKHEYYVGPPYHASSTHVATYPYPPCGLRPSPSATVSSPRTGTPNVEAEAMVRMLNSEGTAWAEAKAEHHYHYQLQHQPQTKREVETEEEHPKLQGPGARFLPSYFKITPLLSDYYPPLPTRSFSPPARLATGVAQGYERGRQGSDPIMHRRVIAAADERTFVNKSKDGASLGRSRETVLDRTSSVPPVCVHIGADEETIYSSPAQRIRAHYSNVFRSYER